MTEYIFNLSPNRKYLCIIISLLFLLAIVSYLNFFSVIGMMVGLLSDPEHLLAAIATGILIPYEKPKIFFLTIFSITLFLHLQVHFSRLEIGLNQTTYGHIFFVCMRFFSISFLGAIILELKYIVNNKLMRIKDIK